MPRSCQLPNHITNARAPTPRWQRRIDQQIFSIRRRLSPRARLKWTTMQMLRQETKMAFWSSYLQLRSCHTDIISSLIRSVPDHLANDIWLWLLIYNHPLHMSERRQSLFLDAADEVLTCRNVVDQADDLSCCPYLCPESARPINRGATNQ